MRCPKCKKRIKENTEGNLNYCQGHGIEESLKVVKENRLKAE